MRRGYLRYLSKKKLALYRRVGFPFVLQMRLLRYETSFTDKFKVPRLARSNALFVGDS